MAAAGRESVHVLLVEDSAGDAFLAQELLAADTERDFVCTHVTRLSEAVEHLRQRAADAVLVDLGLPDARGLQAVRAIRATAPNVALVVLTGRQVDEGIEAVRAGADDYLSKHALAAVPLARAICYAIERRRLLTELFAGVSDGVLVVGFDGVVRFANASVQRLLGKAEAELIGHDLDLGCEMGRAGDVPLSGNRLAEIEWSQIDWYGERAQVATLRDITSRRRVDELRRRLNHADKLASIGQLAAGVAHEINNPAAFVTMNMYAMRDLVQEAASLAQGRLAEVFRQMDEIVGENLEGMTRIRSIVEEMRAFSRADSDVLEVVELNEAMRAALRFSQREITHRAQLLVDFGDDLPPVLGNRGQLIQVFLNLLVNAAHAIRTGAAQQNSVRVKSMRDGARVVAVITDSGAGIPRDEQERIFDPFYTTKPRELGTGLGLALVANIINDHGGTIEIESDVGRGSRFTVALPMMTPEQIAQHSPRPEPTPVEAMAPVLSERRVLIIDDEESIRRALVRLLVREWQVVEAGSGSEALEVLDRDDAFDAVLCDLMMPGMDGMAFFDRVTQEHPRIAGRILFITGGAVTPGARQFVDGLPADRIVTKPFDTHQLASALARVTQGGAVG